MSHPNVYMGNTECLQNLQQDDIGMSSKHLMEDWFKLCDAIAYFNYSSQSILAMNLFKDFKLVFTQKPMAHKFNINRKYKSKTLSELTKTFNLWLHPGNRMII